MGMEQNPVVFANEGHNHPENISDWIRHNATIAADYFSKRFGGWSPCCFTCSDSDSHVHRHQLHLVFLDLLPLSASHGKAMRAKRIRTRNSIRVAAAGQHQPLQSLDELIVAARPAALVHDMFLIFFAPFHGLPPAWGSSLNTICNGCTA